MLWQERDAFSQALIANLRQQIVTLQLDGDREDAEEEHERDDDAADE